jgi:hypothetical protein
VPERFRGEDLTARRTRTLAREVPSTVVGKRRGAIRANDAEVLKTVVICNPVDVVEHERHSVAVPELSLAAHLADGLLDAGREKPLFQLAPSVGRVLDHGLLERQLARLASATPPSMGIEVPDGKLPPSGSFF